MATDPRSDAARADLREGHLEGHTAEGHTPLPEGRTAGTSHPVMAIHVALRHLRIGAVDTRAIAGMGAAGGRGLLVWPRGRRSISFKCLSGLSISTCDTTVLTRVKDKAKRPISFEEE